MYLAHGSGEVLFSVESVVRLCHQSMSCVSVLSVPERCRSVKGRCSSARLVLFLVLLHYWWSASLSSYCMCLFFFSSQPLCEGFSLACSLTHIYTHTPDRRRTLVPWMIWEAWFLCQSLDSRPSCALQSGIYNQTPVNLIYFNKSMLVLLQTHQKNVHTHIYTVCTHFSQWSHIIGGYFLSRSLYLLVMNSYAFLHVVNNQIKF